MINYDNLFLNNISLLILSKRNINRSNLFFIITI